MEGLGTAVYSKISVCRKTFPVSGRGLDEACRGGWGGGWDADNPTCAQSVHCSSRKGNVVRLPSSFVILSLRDKAKTASPSIA